MKGTYMKDFNSQPAPWYVGEARGIEQRSELRGGYAGHYGGSMWHYGPSFSSEQILAFRLVLDSPVDGGEMIQVELRGRSLEGSIKEGERVQVEGPRKPGRPLRVKEVYNLTTQSRVGAVPLPAWAKALITLFVIFIAGWFIFLALVATDVVSLSGGSPGPGDGSRGQSELNSVSVVLSPDSGPVGSTVKLNGSGFEPGESVEVRVGAQLVATARY